jgi:hypothetical protein
MRHKLRGGGGHTYSKVISQVFLQNWEYGLQVPIASCLGTGTRAQHPFSQSITETAHAHGVNRPASHISRLKEVMISLRIRAMSATNLRQRTGRDIKIPYERVKLSHDHFFRHPFLFIVRWFASQDRPRPLLSTSFPVLHLEICVWS